MNKQIIDCACHDFIEIACLYGYEIELELHSGEIQRGKAITTQTSKDKKEFLIIQTPTTNLPVELIEIKSMTAQQQNPYFSCINF